jgi:hypothetical protein
VRTGTILVFRAGRRRYRQVVIHKQYACFGRRKRGLAPSPPSTLRRQRASLATVPVAFSDGRRNLCRERPPWRSERCWQNGTPRRAFPTRFGLEPPGITKLYLAL